MSKSKISRLRREADGKKDRSTIASAPSGMSPHDDELAQRVVDAAIAWAAVPPEDAGRDHAASLALHQAVCRLQARRIARDDTAGRELAKARGKKAHAEQMPDAVPDDTEQAA